MLIEPMPGSLVLSAGAVFDKTFPCQPYNPYPTPSTTSIIFTDTAGEVITTITGVVTAAAATYLNQPSDVDEIPAGANYEVFITTPVGPYKVEYGRVVRRQVTYPNAPTQQVNAQALEFSPSLQFTGNTLSAEWVPIAGHTVLLQHTDKPNSIAVDCTGILGFGTQAKSAIRYWTPLNTDSWKFELQFQQGGSGMCHFIFGANAFFTSFMYVTFNSENNKMVIGFSNGGAYSDDGFTDEIEAISHTVGELEAFTVTYDNITHTVNVYDQNSETPMLTWTDSAGVVPHGKGYRYFGASWESQEIILESGPQICGIGGQDSVGD